MTPSDFARAALERRDTSTPPPTYHPAKIAAPDPREEATGPVVVVAYGLPVAQGSKATGKRKDGSTFTRDSNASALKPWRKTVAEEARAVKMKTGMIAGYVAIRVCFTLDKPKSAYRGAKSKKPRQLPAGKDIDKLVRSVFDSLGRKHGAGLIEDDMKVIELTAVKSYPNEHPDALDCPGVRIEVRRVT